LLFLSLKLYYKVSPFKKNFKIAAKNKIKVT